MTRPEEKQRAPRLTCDIAHHTILNVLAISRNNTENRVVAALRVLAVHGIHIVRGAVDLSVRGVRLHSHNLLLQVLIEVHLTGADQVPRGDGAVVVEGPVGVDLDVDVDRALDVEAGEDGLHLHHAVGVGRPHRAQPGRVVGVQIRDAELVRVGDVELRQKIREPSVGRQGREARVGPRRVAVPEAHEDALEGLAGSHVENANVHP